MKCLFLRIVRSSGLLALHPRPVTFERLNEALDFALPAGASAEIANERVTFEVHERAWVAIQRLEYSRATQ
jgi:hypothetical protein